MTDFGIYVHIPFCKNKCAYCNFCSGTFSETLQEKYFQKLWQEILHFKTEKKITSIFFGGGTPSAVKSDYIIRTLNVIFKNFIVDNNAEITLEANPGTVKLQSLTAYKVAGFNRISFGGQSFDEETLKKLGRVHSAEEIFEAVSMAKQAGFENIGIDVIIGANTINQENFIDSVKRCKKLGVKHFSVYMLMLEKNTPLCQQVISGKTRVLDEREVASDYRFVQITLPKEGFLQYEISNFSQNGFQCRHNQNYWHAGQYKGFGVSSHSYVDDLRAENTSNLEEYLALDIEKLNVSQDYVTTHKKIIEKIMLSLRTTKGLCLEELKKLGYNLKVEKRAVLDTLINTNFVQEKDGFVKISPQNFVVSNAIILKLIP